MLPSTAEATSSELPAITASDLPLSPIFIDFLAKFFDAEGFGEEKWPDQISEALVNNGTVMRQQAAARLQRLLLDERAQSIVRNVYQNFYQLTTASPALLDANKRIHKFIAIVGIARTGGSYLTAELFSAVGMNPGNVPAAIAHDGFPDCQPFSLSFGCNQWIKILMELSEYLSMVDLYFPGDKVDQSIIVPKKLTKGIYAGGLFNSILGESAEYVITIRHPIAACVSTYEKSGGLPADGLYKMRSNIEIWIKRDQFLTGETAQPVESMDYFTAYVRYWEQYYINLALSGLTANRSTTVIAFGKHRMQAMASQWHRRFNSGKNPTEFKPTASLVDRHPSWLRRSEEAMNRVLAVWQLVGLTFPLTELQECL